MLDRRRWPILSALLAAPLAAAGCVTDTDGAGAPRGFPWIVESKIPRTRSDLHNPQALDLSYARWQEQVGHLSEAEESYRRVLKNDAKSIDARLGLARLEQLAGHTQEAEQAFLQVVEANPKSAQALDALGQFYAAEQRWPEAVSTLAQAVEVAPQDPVCRHHYAVVLARSGNHQAAYAEFSQLVGEAEAHYNIGYILHEQGRSEQAEREFLMAVTLQPELTSAQMMLDELRRGREGTPLASKYTPPKFLETSTSTVTQTAAVASDMPARQISTAAATESMRRPAAPPQQTVRGPSPAASQPYSNPPMQVAQPAATQPAATQPVETQPGEAQPAASGSSSEWQMPVRHDPASIFKEQLRNQVPVTEQQ